MNKALLISFILHTAAGLYLYLPSSQPNTQHVTSVELVSSLAPKQRERAKRVMGNNSSNLSNENTHLAKKKKQPNLQKGQDSISVTEIKSGNTQNPRHATVANYAQELQQYIERNRYYPRRALVMEQSGTIRARLTINPDGSFSKVEIIERSEHSILNKAAQELLSQLKVFKPFPQTYKGNGIFIVPIEYQLKTQQN